MELSIMGRVALRIGFMKLSVTLRRPLTLSRGIDRFTEKEASMICGKLPRNGLSAKATQYLLSHESNCDFRYRLPRTLSARSQAGWSFCGAGNHIRGNNAADRLWPARQSCLYHSRGSVGPSQPTRGAAGYQ